MDLSALLKNKTIKGKEKTEQIAEALLNNSLNLESLIETAKNSKDADKATCIEAIEFAIRSDTLLATEPVLKFVSETLNNKAPRIKWESAKVIGNIANLFPTKLDKAISNLLTNSRHPGTVVRWASAFALGEILKLKTQHNVDLLPAIDNIIKQEEKNSIKKIYLAANSVLNV